MPRKIPADLYGTHSHWHCGADAGAHAARMGEPGDLCPARKDFADVVSDDYFDGYVWGWQDSPYTVPEVTFGNSGPGAPVYVRCYNSRTAMMRANRDRQCKGA